MVSEETHENITQEMLSTPKIHALMPKVLVLGGGDFGRCLGHKSGAS